MPLLLRLAGADHAALARQVEYLVVENRILRSKIPGQIRLTERERQRLTRFGRAVGPAMKDLISVVKYKTFVGWLSPRRRGRKAHCRPGRPRTVESVEQLVIRIARETGWGSERILGELRKLGVRSVCRTTVRNILKRHGIEPAPDRADPTWDTFLRRHAETLWACDFFTTRVLTERGWKWASVLVLVRIQSRKVIVTQATQRPDCQWAGRRPMLGSRGRVDGAAETHGFDQGQRLEVRGVQGPARRGAAALRTPIGGLIRGDQVFAPRRGKAFRLQAAISSRISSAYDGWRRPGMRTLWIRSSNQLGLA